MPNPNDPNNPSQAYNPATPPAFAQPFYFGSGCDVRLRPHVLNSLISENLSLLDRVGLAYNPGLLFNTRLAVEYIFQRGQPQYSVLTAQGDPAYYYTGALDPPVRGLINGMVLTVLPSAENHGFVRIDVGNGGWVPVLRNDYEELRRGDWPAHIPQRICYYNGAFYLLGLAKSQVPLVLVGAINFWVRPDGNDETGDGLANSPDRAFRTIDGCWYAVGSRYAASPAATINIRLGIPGNYEGADIGPFGSSVNIIGDQANAAAYRILTKAPAATGGVLSWSLHVTGISRCGISGVNLVMTALASVSTNCLRVSSSNVDINYIQMTLEVSSPNAGVLILGKSDMYANNANLVQGNGNTVGFGFSLVDGSHYSGTLTAAGCDWTWQNINFASAGYTIDGASGATHGNTRVHNYATGPRYSVSGWSILTKLGYEPPGNVAGTATPQGLVNP